MPRRRVPPKRPAQPDPLFGSKEISLLVGRMMLRGKKSAGYAIMYKAFQIIKEKLNKEPLEVFTKALENVKPVVEVKSRRVGGSTYHAFNSTGSAFKKKEDTHRMAEANKAFAHYRW
jgi:small subunit ribosomal protein S7